MTNGWTAERRARQARMIRQWQPWKTSTRPKSAEGKAIVAGNSFKGGTRPLLRELARALREQRKLLKG